MMILPLLLLLLFSSVHADGAGAGRIVGGSKVDSVDDFPFHAIIQSIRIDNKGEEVGVFCGGTLISDIHVLTAAHCVDKRDIVFTAATLGRLRKEDSVYDAAEVVEIIIHPNWSRATARHDIAVLRLADPMPGYQPARLPFGVGQVPKKDDDVTVLGFGLEDGDADGLSDDLRQVTIEVQKKDDCDPFGFPFSINKKFCAGGEGKTPCHGDSGGPAIANGDEVVGVSSMGDDDCDESPAIFTRVSAYADFIRDAACGGPGQQPPWCGPLSGSPDVPAPTPAALDGGGSFCFHGSSLVEVPNGVVRMEDLELGDMVQVGDGIYEPIYSFGHHAPMTDATFLQITTQQSKLRLTADHMLFTPSRGAVPAGLLQVGDYVMDAAGAHDRIEAIKTVKGRGLYAPFTPSGRIVVDSILASSYVALEESEGLDLFGVVTLSHQWLSHAVQFPHRIVCFHLGKCQSETYTPEGIPLRLDELRKVGQWLLRGPQSLRFLWMIPLSIVAALFTMMEAAVIRPWMTLFIVALILSSRRSLKAKKA